MGLAGAALHATTVGMSYTPNRLFIAVRNLTMVGLIPIGLLFLYAIGDGRWPTDPDFDFLHEPRIAFLVCAILVILIWGSLVANVVLGVMSGAYRRAEESFEAPALSADLETEPDDEDNDEPASARESSAVTLDLSGMHIDASGLLIPAVSATRISWDRLESVDDHATGPEFSMNELGAYPNDYLALRIQGLGTITLGAIELAHCDYTLGQVGDAIRWHSLPADSLGRQRLDPPHLLDIEIPPNLERHMR
jgi:hypothetical protein